MASSSAAPSPSSDLWNYGLESIAKSFSPADIILLPLVILGSAFIINRGSILPKSDPLHYKWFERPQEALGARIQTKTRTRNIAELVKQNSADVVVFWGSQSGTAEGFAHRLAREAHQRFKLKPVVADLSDYDAETIAQIPGSTLVLFVVSTYGEGDPSDNAQDFISWINSTRRAAMGHLRFAAFGCGNSNYKYYNKIVDEVVNAMQKFGATMMLPTGKGNEATRTTEEDFADWKASLFATLVSQLGLTEGERVYEPLVDVTEQPSASSDEVQLSRPFQKAGTQSLNKSRDIVSVPVTGHRVLTKYADQDRSCVQVTVDLSAYAQVKYRTGDHIAVWPENSTEEVNRLLRVLKIEHKRSTPIQITPKSDYDEVKVPALTTVEALFRCYLEICSPVPRETVLSLATVAPSATIKQALEKIGSDRETYAVFLQSNYLTFSRLLEHALAVDPAASWESLPLSFIIDTVPTMQPRLYSIASSRITSPRAVALTVSVKPSELTASPGTMIPGLCSSHLSSTQPLKDAQVGRPNLHVQIRASTFKLPVNIAIPLVMVAAGTGIAPLRAFLQERGRLSSVGREVGPMILFFGCQSEADYLYQDEFQDLMSGSLAGKLEVVTAFSRIGTKKVYVQDVVRQRKQDVVQFLGEKDAAFYVCGAATMAKAVSAVLSEATMEVKGWSESQVADWMASRKKDNRWFEDVWS